MNSVLLTIDQIARFERQNNKSINVDILKKKTTNSIVDPIYLTKGKREKLVNYLFKTVMEIKINVK